MGLMVFATEISTTYQTGIWKTAKKLNLNLCSGAVSEEWLQFPTTIADTNKNHSHISEYRISSVLNMTGKLTEKIVASRLA